MTPNRQPILCLLAAAIATAAATAQTRPATLPASTPSAAPVEKAPPPATRPALPTLPEGQTVYQSVFKSGNLRPWQGAQLTQTPTDKIDCLGLFNNQKVVLALDSLPAHKYVRLRFDLYIIGSWDGYAQPGENWTLSVVGGPLLARKVFRLPTGGRDTSTQSFPGEAPLDQMPSASGAAAVNTLGYTHGQRNRTPLDAVYQLDLAIPHKGGKLEIAFAAEGLQPATDESWGLNNVQVDTLPEGRTLDASQIEDLIDLLGSEDIAAAEAAKWALISSPQAVEPLRRLLGAHRPDKAQLDRLISQLDSNDWRKRRDASEALAAAGLAVRPEIEAALKNPPSLEARSRLEDLLGRMKQPTGPDAARTRRLARAVQALEIAAWQAQP